MTSAVRNAIDWDGLVGVPLARAELALAMARIVDANGSHLAAAQLRALLDEIELREAEAESDTLSGVMLPSMPNGGES